MHLLPVNVVPTYFSSVSQFFFNSCFTGRYTSLNASILSWSQFSKSTSVFFFVFLKVKQNSDHWLWNFGGNLWIISHSISWTNHMSVELTTCHNSVTDGIVILHQSLVVIIPNLLPSGHLLDVCLAYPKVSGQTYTSASWEPWCIPLNHLRTTAMPSLLHLLNVEEGRSFFVCWLETVDHEPVL